MKKKVYEDQIRQCVSLALDVSEYSVEMPCKENGTVSVRVHGHSGTRRCDWWLSIPNDTLAEMIWGDHWDGDASESAFRFGGGGYDPVWFECGVNE